MILAKFFIVVAFDGVYVYTMELFPTVIRFVYFNWECDIRTEKGDCEQHIERHFDNKINSDKFGLELVT